MVKLPMKNHEYYLSSSKFVTKNTVNFIMKIIVDFFGLNFDQVLKGSVFEAICVMKLFLKQIKCVFA